jgi:hypothetical protein
MFDPNKIKMKYTLGIWRDLPEYPQKEDVIFELISTIAKISDGKWEITEKQLDSFFAKYPEFNQKEEVIQILEETTKGQKKIYTLKESLLKQYL